MKCIIRKRKTSSPRSVMSSDIVGSLKRQNLRQTKNPQLYLDTTRKNHLIRVLSIAYVCLAGVVFLSTRCLRARRRASGTWRPRRARRTRLGTHPRCAHRSRRPLRARGRLLHGCRVCGRSHGRLHRYDAFHLDLDVGSSCWLSGAGRRGEWRTVRRGNGDFNLPEIFRHWTIPGVLFGQ
jgi:hypothetical protein